MNILIVNKLYRINRFTVSGLSLKNILLTAHSFVSIHLKLKHLFIDLCLYVNEMAEFRIRKWLG